MLVPGAGQVYAGERRRGVALFACAAALTGVVVAFAATSLFDAAARLADRRSVVALVVADAVLLAIRLFAVVDAWRRGGGAASRVAVGVLVGIGALTAAPHVASAYYAVRGHAVLESVFAEAEPRDVLPAQGVFLERSSLPARPAEPRRTEPHAAPPPVPAEPLPGSRRILVGSDRRFERPWVTMLLLGTDKGPGNWGERTDTMIVAALERGTGRAVAFGVPRNLVEVPLGGAAGRELPRFHEPLNGLYSFARTRPELFPGGDDAGATALKQTVSRLLGIRVDYYALVTLDGFRDLVDALGGVTIHVKERLRDAVTRPAWGESHPRIDVHPGRTYHFSGSTALAYARARKASDDYRRMARQRCFLSAMADQLDVVGVLRHFPSLASTVERSMRTDIPIGRLPDLLRLVAAMESRKTLTVTFGRKYIARRRATDRFPLPNVAKIRATARRAIEEGRPLRSADVLSMRRAC